MERSAPDFAQVDFHMAGDMLFRHECGPRAHLYSEKSAVPGKLQQAYDDALSQLDWWTPVVWLRYRAADQEWVSFTGAKGESLIDVVAVGQGVYPLEASSGVLSEFDNGYDHADHFPVLLRVRVAPTVKAQTQAVRKMTYDKMGTEDEAKCLKFR